VLGAGQVGDAPRDWSARWLIGELSYQGCKGIWDRVGGVAESPEVLVVAGLRPVHREQIALFPTGLAQW